MRATGRIPPFLFPTVRSVFEDCVGGAAVRPASSSGAFRSLSESIPDGGGREARLLRTVKNGGRERRFPRWRGHRGGAPPFSIRFPDKTGRPRPLLPLGRGRSFPLRAGASSARRRPPLPSPAPFFSPPLPAAGGKGGRDVVRFADFPYLCRAYKTDWYGKRKVGEVRGYGALSPCV